MNELLRALTFEEVETLVNMAYDVFERDADNPLGGNFKIHSSMRNQYVQEIRAMYEKKRRGDA